MLTEPVSSLASTVWIPTFDRSVMVKVFLAPTLVVLCATCEAVYGNFRRAETKQSVHGTTQGHSLLNRKDPVRVLQSRMIVYKS